MLSLMLGTKKVTNKLQVPLLLSTIMILTFMIISINELALFYKVFSSL